MTFWPRFCWKGPVPLSTGLQARNRRNSTQWSSLRGFPPHRFVGTKRILANGEVRYRFAEFDFKQLWHIRIDGAVFGDVGRVFIDNNDLPSEFGANEDILRSQTDRFQYSLGVGCHIGFSEALLARIDVGFSEENTGLVFLSFGHMF